MTVAILILAFELSIVPDLTALSILLIFGPQTIVGRLISTHKRPLPIPLIVLKVTNVVAAIGVDHATIAIILSDCPIAIVASAVWPDLEATTVALRAAPLARILDHDVILADLGFASLHNLLVHLQQHFFALFVSICYWPKPLDNRIDNL